MIREENLKLNQSLEKAAEDQRETCETLKVTKGQLEREKAKNKVMLKRLKAENSIISNHNSLADEGQCGSADAPADVIWHIQKVDQNRNIEIRPPTAGTAPTTPAKANIKANRVSLRLEFDAKY